MHDWYLLLTPLLVLPIASLFAFVGCTLDHAALMPRPPATNTTIMLSFQGPLHGTPPTPARSVSDLTFTITVDGGSPVTLDLNPATSMLTQMGTFSPSTGMTTMATVDPPTVNIPASFFQVTIHNPPEGMWQVHCAAMLSGLPNPSADCGKPVRFPAGADMPAPLTFTFSIPEGATTIHTDPDCI
jgi:hypothetical protein